MNLPSYTNLSHLKGVGANDTVSGKLHFTNLSYKLDQLQNEGTIEIDKLWYSGWKTGLLHFFTTLFRIRKVFDKDPDPWFRTTRLRIRILLFFSVTFKVPTKNTHFSQFFSYNLPLEHLRQCLKIRSYKEVKKLFCLLMEGTTVSVQKNNGSGFGRSKSLRIQNTISQLFISNLFFLAKCQPKGCDSKKALPKFLSCMSRCSCCIKDSEPDVSLQRHIRTHAKHSVKLIEMF